MGRLTERNQKIGNLIKDLGTEACSNVCGEIPCSECPVQKAVDKLADYEDAGEAGLLIKLPVAVGQNLWAINDIYKGKKIVGRKVVEQTVDNFVIGGSVVAQVCDQENNWEDIEVQDIGKTVYLTREAAEKALEGNQKRPEGL